MIFSVFVLLWKTRPRGFSEKEMLLSLGFSLSYVAVFVAGCSISSRESKAAKEQFFVAKFLNSIILQVRVPVLSEKMYSTWPSSSFRFVDWARH